MGARFRAAAHYVVFAGAIQLERHRGESLALTLRKHSPAFVCRGCFLCLLTNDF